MKKAIVKVKTDSQSFKSLWPKISILWVYTRQSIDNGDSHVKGNSNSDGNSDSDSDGNNFNDSNGNSDSDSNGNTNGNNDGNSNSNSNNDSNTDSGGDNVDNSAKKIYIQDELGTLVYSDYIAVTGLRLSLVFFMWRLIRSN